MPILDAIEKGITKARDLGELSRLSGEIAMRERHQKERFAVLGERYYDALKHGTAPDCAVLYEELEAIDQELLQLRKQMQKVRRVTICPRCGTRLPSFGAFCPACGAGLATNGVCPHCGAPLDADAKFCVNCGKQTTEPGDRRG